MGKENITPWHQYRDPLVGILDYIVQVCPLNMSAHLMALIVPKEM